MILLNNRSILVSLIILPNLISVACGELKISASTGDEHGSSGYTEFLGASISDQIHESTVLSGSSLSHSFKSSGDKAQTFSVTNNAGDHAEVGFEIKNSNSYSGSYTLSPETADYAKATEKLDVNGAESIYAFGYAITRDQYNSAGLDLSVIGGSLVGYSNSAYATLGKATVEQKMKSASGQSVWVNEYAGSYYPQSFYTVGELYPLVNYNIAETNVAESGGVKLTDYSGSATATDKKAQKKRSIGSFSADWMNWGSSAYNTEGDDVYSLIQITNGKISKYSMTTTATPTYVDSIIDVGSARGDNIDASGNSYNYEGESASAHIADSGAASIKKLYLNPNAGLDSVKSIGKISTISGSIIEGTGTAFNVEGDSSQTSISITNGNIKTWNSDNRASKGSLTKSKISLASAKGSSTDITSQGLNQALGYEYQYDLNTETNEWDRTLVPVNVGEGNFAARKVKNAEFKNVMVTTQATTNDITISTSGFGKKTSLILDPRRWEFEDSEYNRNNGAMAGIDIRDPIMNSLKNAGYAVTYYSDSAVSQKKVGQMDDYWVSVINTHANSYLLELSKSSDGSNPDYVHASDLKYDNKHKDGLWKNSNGMIVLTICDTFTDRGPGTLADAARKASCSAGFTSETGIDFSRNFLISYFGDLSEGNTALHANNAAEGTDSFDGSIKQLLLRGSKKNSFKL